MLQKLKKKCHDCGVMIDGLYYTDNNNKTLCENDYKVNDFHLILTFYIYSIFEEETWEMQKM